MATAVASSNPPSSQQAPSKPSASRSRRDKDDTSNPDINLASIGNYVFIKTLGEGNFAKVKLAKHKITGTEVAIKVIDKTQLDEKKLSKLYREVRIMKMLHHPHIVKLYEVIETKHTVFLVMECATGGELYDYLVVHGRMKEKEARAKFRQILSAVSYCHKMRVIHRDLKAENLLLDENMNIKIADFGFSNMYDPDGKLDTFCGSPPYAAPELFQGKRYVGPEVDIWSLGVILYVLTTGCLPFDGKNLQEMRESVCRGKYRIPFYLSDSCEKLLRKFLIRDPFKRASLEMLIDDPWINESYPDSPITSDLGEKVEEDENIIRIIESKYHIPRESVYNSLRGNAYDDIAAMYYLLYYQRDRHGIISPTDGTNSSGSQSPSSATSPSHSNVPPGVGLAQSFNAGTKTNAANAMHTIEEDTVSPLPNSFSQAGEEGMMRQRAVPASGQSGAAASANPSAPANRRRRFTVGGESDASKAGEENDATAALRKLQSELRDQQTRKALDQGKTTGAPTPSTQSNVSASSPSSDSASGQENQAPRRRTSTVVGIFSKITGGSPSSSMNAGTPTRRQSDAAAMLTHMQQQQKDQSADKDDGGVNKPRSLRFTFNSNTTSTKPPDEIVSEVLKSCNKMAIVHRLASRYVIECQCSPTAESSEPVKFEIEICKLPRLKNLHGLKFKRLSGTTADYKDICEALLKILQL